MQKIDRGGDARWCPECGCLQDSNGVWYVPSHIPTEVIAGLVVGTVCQEHMESEYWGKSEREIILGERSKG